MKTIAGILFTFGALTALYAGLLANSDLEEYSFAKSKSIEGMFLSAATRIDTYYTKNGRYPNQTQFESWRSTLNSKGLIVNNLGYYSGNISEPSVIKIFGKPNIPTYYLRYWRGEWSEYYSGWQGESTLPKQISAYYSTGTKYGDIFLTIAVSALFMLLAIYLFRRA